jgi:hypothetical protein
MAGIDLGIRGPPFEVMMIGFGSGASPQWLPDSCKGHAVDLNDLHPGGLAPGHPEHCHYRCPLVYSTSGWVSQRLSSHEVVKVYDMPVGLWRTGKLPFLGTTPLKLLQSCAKSVQQVLGVNRGWSPMEPQKSKACIGHSPENQGVGQDCCGGSI